MKKIFAFLAAALLLAGTGLAALLPRMREEVAVAGVFAAAATVLLPVVTALRGGTVPPLSLPWPLPWGTLALGLDGLSALFCLPTVVLAPLSALYGLGYRRGGGGKKASPFLFNLLVASLLLIPAARDGLFFLICWETMALSSFFLVGEHHEAEKVRRAAWIYLVATHLGTMALLAFFAFLGNEAVSLSFEAFAGLDLSSSAATTLFLLALVGFGAKAGLVPFHIWLPEAHPAAPSHVSALLSAVMLKMGLYGLLRTLTFLQPREGWGWTLLFLGLVSALSGLLFALGQKDLKRMLAYSSVENVGIAVLAFGIALVGLCRDLPSVAFLAFSGGLLHVLNHALFKGLLFLGAGTVLRRCGTGEMDRLGGLLRNMPRTGGALFVGSWAIAALPPLNGFVGEFLLYLAGIESAMTGETPSIAAGAIVLAGLASVGALGAACFARFFGIVFLGQGRSERALQATEAPLSMTLPLGLLALLCLAAGLAAPFMLLLAAPGAAILAGSADGALLAGASATLQKLTLSTGLLVAAVALVALVRRGLSGRAPKDEGPTWDCGYVNPTARMQYTATSFSRPLTDLFSPPLRTGFRGHRPEGLFPEPVFLSTETPGTGGDGLFRPLFRAIDRLLAPLRLLQQGRVQLYVLYIALTLVALLIGKAGSLR